MRGPTIALWCALVLVAAATATAEAEQGPYEDIQALLANAAASSSSLAALDSRGAPRVIEVHHHHDHVVPVGMSRRQAEDIAVANTPPNPPVRIISVPNRAQAARHAAEDARFNHPTHTTVSIGIIPSKPKASEPREYTIKGQDGKAAEDEAWRVQGTGFHFPLVDRGLKRATFPVIADTDGSGAKETTQPHTAAEMQAEALRLLKKAKQLQAKKNAANANAAAESLGVFDSKDEGFEDELTRLKRVSARMNRLLEQIQTAHPGDSFEGSIARKRYFLKIYKQLKADATKIIEGYALRTGNSIFELFGDGKIDPSIAAFLPPNSVAGILAQYANPNRGRLDETPRDLISGKDAKRIKYSIDYFHAKRDETKLPLPPVYALSDEEERLKRRDQNPLFNKVVASQEGAFGQGRPAVTSGNQAIGRSSVHISVVNPTENQKQRGLPFQVNLKRRRTSKLN
jgi:hypothetical protein